jgi:hypothetical protein
MHHQEAQILHRAFILESRWLLNPVRETCAEWPLRFRQGGVQSTSNKKPSQCDENSLVLAVVLNQRVRSILSGTLLPDSSSVREGTVYTKSHVFSQQYCSAARTSSPTKTCSSVSCRGGSNWRQHRLCINEQQHHMNEVGLLEHRH